VTQFQQRKQKPSQVQEWHSKDLQTSGIFRVLSVSSDCSPPTPQQNMLEISPAEIWTSNSKSFAEEPRGPPDIFRNNHPISSKNLRHNFQIPQLIKDMLEI
jgi:hypothetical protein